MAGIAVVTGASRGIGRATALRLALNGYRVFALARSEDDLRDLALQASRVGAIVEPVKMDIADDVSRQEAVAAVLQSTEGYGADLLVNNAGYGQMGPMEEISPDLLRRQFEVNVVGQLAITQPFLPGMRQRGRGTVVNVSSVAGRLVGPFSGAYAASKAALEAASDALRLELAPFGVRVILIEPGPIRTSFSQVGRATMPDREASPYARFIDLFEEGRKSWYIFEQPPEAVAGVIVRAAGARRPRARYAVTFPARMTNIVRRLAPDRVSDYVLRRAMGDHGSRI